MDVFERQEIARGVAAELVDLDNIRVVEPRDDAAFAKEHFDEGVLLGEVWEDALDDDEALEPCDAALAREKHLGHPARGKSRQEFILADAFRCQIVLAHASGCSETGVRRISSPRSDRATQVRAMWCLPLTV